MMDDLTTKLKDAASQEEFLALDASIQALQRKLAKNRTTKDNQGSLITKLNADKVAADAAQALEDDAA